MVSALVGKVSSQNVIKKSQEGIGLCGRDVNNNNQKAAQIRKATLAVHT